MTNDELIDRKKLIEELEELETDDTRRMTSDDLQDRIESLRELEELEA